MGKRLPIGIRLLILLLLLLLATGQVYAEEQNSNYLKYQEPQPPSTSILSTIAYVFTLLVTFAIVIGLAYFTSRVLGKKLGVASGYLSSRVLATIPLGANRSLQIVDVAGKVFILGVTDHSITLLQEVTDPEEIEKLRNTDNAAAKGFDQVFQRQLLSLQHMSQKFPAVFGTNRSSESEQEKR